MRSSASACWVLVLACRAWCYSSRLHRGYLPAVRLVSWWKCSKPQPQPASVVSKTAGCSHWLFRYTYLRSLAFGPCTISNGLDGVIGAVCSDFSCFASTKPEWSVFTNRPFTFSSLEVVQRFCIWQALKLVCVNLHRLVIRRRWLALITSRPY